MGIFSRASAIERGLRGRGLERPAARGQRAPILASAGAAAVTRGLAGAGVRPRALVGRRGYQAAALSRLNVSFPGVFGTGDAEIRISLRRVRARCRQLAQDSDYVKRALWLMKQNVVGARGIRLKMLAKDPDSGVVDADANRRIEERWARQCERELFTVTGQLDSVAAQELVLEAIVRDGEIFVRQVRGFDNAHRFALEMVEADLVDDELDRVLSKDRSVRMGIEFDRWSRPRAYWLRPRHPGEYGLHGLYLSASDHERVDAALVQHCYAKERVTQSRGMPWYHTTALGIDMMQGAEEAELVASRIAASKMGFYKTPSGGEYEGDAETEEGPITEAEAGVFEELPKDWDFEAFDPQHPTTAFEPFLRHFRQKIASGMNLSYYLLANDGGGVTYSTGRLFSLNDRDFFRSCQRLLARTLLQPAFAQWLTDQVTLGLLNLPPRKLDAYIAGARWRGRGWAWVDPQKEGQGNREAYELGVTSLTQIAAEAGLDLEDVIEERKAELALFREAGLEPPVPRTAAAAPSEDDEDDEDEEE